jgi:hypothetical protein
MMGCCRRGRKPSTELKKRHLVKDKYAVREL